MYLQKLQAGTKLTSALVNKTNLALSFAIAILLAASLLAYTYQAGQINDLSSRLAEKTKIADLQNQQIQQYANTVASQEQELEDKAARLQDLGRQIQILSEDISAKEKAIADKTAEADKLNAALAQQRLELERLKSEAATLEIEISVLEDEIESKDQQILELKKQVELQQAQLDAVKRTRVSHYGLGVNEAGTGVAFPIEIEIISSGDGTISVDVSNVQYEASFQDAVRTAATVASEYSGISVADKDIIVRFVNDKSGIIRVDGPSAGAAIAGMMVAGLTEKEINHSVLVTGSIKADGTVGRIGGLQGKSDAAVTFGATMLLVPKVQQFAHDKIQVIGVSDISEVVKYLVKS